MRTLLLTPVLTILIILFACTWLQGQTFISPYQLGQSSMFYDVARLSSGNYVCVGSASLPGNTVTAVIFSPTGQMLKEWHSATPTGQAARSVVATPDGGFMLVGEGAVPGSSSLFMAMRFNNQGDSIWARSYNLAHGGQYTQALSIVNTADGGFAIAGMSRHSQQNSFPDLCIIKVDSLGDSLWSYIYVDSLGYEGAHSIINTSDGGLLITGRRLTTNYGYGIVIKLDANGNEVWKKEYLIPQYPLYQLYATELTNGNFVLCTDGDHLSNTTMLLINAQGDSLGLARAPSFNNFGWPTLIYAVQGVPDGGVVFTGTGFDSATYQQTIVVMKMDSVLNLVWYHDLMFDFQPTTYPGGRGLIVTNSPENDLAIAGNIHDHSVLILVDSSGDFDHTLVMGQIVKDSNNNCVTDAGEGKARNGMVEVTTGLNSYYGHVNSDGEYSIKVYEGSGTANVQWYPGNQYYSPSSCLAGGTSIALSLNDTVVTDLYGVPLVECAYLTTQVSLTQFALRTCLPATYTVSFCNTGSAVSGNTMLEVTLDPLLVVDSASIPWIAQLPGNVFRFFTGVLNEGDCGSIQLYTTVSCSSVNGQTHCVEAHIYPDSLCTPVSPLWDGSSLKLASACLPGDTIEFTLTNVGTGDMSSPQYYIIAEDNVMYANTQFQLNSGQSLVRKIPGNGATYTMIVPQSEGHPGNSHPLRSVEGCGTNNQGQFSRGFVMQFPQDDQDDFVDILCSVSIAAYDPNEKRSEPLGIGAEGYIDPDQPLDYIIHFQNTGTDTAFLVVLRDTLPPYLDMTTLQLTGASHNYTFQIIGSHILEWTFPNILLPDSNTNEPASHGFVSFSIEQISGNAPGTEIRNRAGIYFDFNPVVLTNYTLNTIVEDYTEKLNVSIEELSNLNGLLKLYPNPNDGLIHLELITPMQGDIEFEVYDLTGRRVMQDNVSGAGPHPISMTHLEEGMYLYRVSAGGDLLGNGKILLTR